MAFTKLCKSLANAFRGKKQKKTLPVQKPNSAVPESDKKSKARLMKEEAASEAFFRRNTKRCPHCLVGVQKSPDGCDTIYCMSTYPPSVSLQMIKELTSGDFCVGECGQVFCYAWQPERPKGSQWLMRKSASTTRIITIIMDGDDVRVKRAKLRDYKDYIEGWFDYGGVCV